MVDDKVKHRAKYINADLTDFNVCKELTLDTDYVFHLAGIKGSIEVTKSRPASFFVPLLMFNTNILEAARLNKVKKLVYTSSIGAYSSAEVFHENKNREKATEVDRNPADKVGFPGLQAFPSNLGHGITDWLSFGPSQGHACAEHT